MREAWNKIEWTDEMLSYLKENFYTKTNRELADHLGLKLTSVRTKCYSMGLKRMELEYWTEPQVRFLAQNFREFGDTELAEIFEVKWHKDKGWSKKHIEKKRRYLKLKRTRSDQIKIKARNTQMGRFRNCAKKRWETTGQAAIGEKRVWFTSEDLPIVVIKTEKGFVHYNRWLWKKHKGKVPKGMNVVITGPDRIEFTVEDLALMTDAELGERNSKNRMPEELRETMKLIKKINRKIKKDEQHN